MTISKKTKINIFLSIAIFLTSAITLFFNTPVVYLEPSPLLILITILGFLISNSFLIFFSNSFIRFIFKNYKNEVVFKIISILIICSISCVTHIIKSIDYNLIISLIAFINSIILTYMYSNNRKNNPFGFTVIYSTISATLALTLVFHLK